MTPLRMMLLGLLGLLWEFPVTATGQTLFPESPVSRVSESAPIRMGEDESVQKIALARALLRDGKLWDAATQLANRDAIVGLNSGVEPDLGSLVRALLEFQQGNLRAADRHAAAVKDFALQGDALLLRALIYAKAGVWTVSQRFLERANDWDPLHASHDKQPALILYLQNLLTARVGTLPRPSIDDDAPWNRHRGRYSGFHYRIDPRATETGRLAVTVWLSGAEPEFRAAFSLEPLERAGQSPVWSIVLCDLEAPPLRVADRLKTCPSEAEFLAFVQSFNPAFGDETPDGRFTLLRAELEALAAFEQGILPLASRWADYAGTRVVHDQVAEPLRAQRASAWTLRTTSEFGPWQPSGYRLSGYVNDALLKTDPAAASRTESPSSSGSPVDPDNETSDGPLEHYVFVISTRKPSLYCGSFAVASDEIEPGERVYFLKRLVLGRATVVATYPELPTFESVAEEVQTFLQQAPVVPLTPTPDAPVRIEDQLEATDEQEAASFQRGLRKVYQVSLVAGTSYQIDIASPDFDASLRIEDAQGKDFHDIEYKGFLKYLDRLTGKEGPRTGKFNAQVVFEAPRTETYRIVATTFEKNRTGQFALTIAPSRQSP